MIVLYILAVVMASIIIMYACDSFEDASDYLGRNMNPGVKGATINAIGSSLPELLATFIFLFGPHVSTTLFGEKGDGFSAGIATCAGSAVFNAVIIPALCILAVMFFGVKTKKGVEKISSIELDKKLILKDGFFFLLAEVVLIVFLGNSILAWWMGLALILVYVVYMGVTLRNAFSNSEENDEDEDEEEDEDEDEDDEESGNGLLGLGWLLDFNERIYKGAEINDKSAKVILGCSVLTIGVACGLLVWGVEHTAHVLEVETYFTAVILAAAATSVPDTVISIKDARKGDYDDAVANAVGSNIFDICVCLGLPLLIYTLCFGDVSLTSNATGADVQILRWVLLSVTICVLSIFLIGRSIGKVKAILLFGLYFIWTSFVIGRSMDAEWTKPIVELFSNVV